jgi:hypothetical protein
MALNTPSDVAHRLAVLHKLINELAEHQTQVADCVSRLETDAERAEAEAAANAKDAERYRWLREQTGAADPEASKFKLIRAYRLEALDAAIDAALAAEKNR